MVAAARIRRGHARALRRDPRTLRAVRDLAASLEDPDGGAALKTVLMELPRLVGAEIGCAYRIGIGPTGASVDLVESSGTSDAFAPTFERFVTQGSSSASIIPTFDFLHPPPSQRNVAVVATEIVPRRVWETSGLATQFLHPLRLLQHEQLRVLVCDGDLLLAWVGVLGTGRYGARELAVLDALTAPLARRLGRDLRLGADALRRLAFDVLVEQLDSAAFLVRDGRFVVHANALGRRLLDARSIDVPRRMAAARAGLDRDVDVLPLTAPGLPAHALVVVRAPRDDLHARLARAAELWKLTPRQTEVVAHLARGEANKTIAERLHCALVTTELHVSAILRKAGVDSRAGLVAKFWTLAD